jgi:uncharacterized protein
MLPASRRESPVYFPLALGLSWLCWIPAGLLGPSTPAWLATALLYAGGLGPLAAALFLLFRRGDRAARRDYWQRATQGRRMGGPWLAITVFTVPLIVASAGLLDGLLGGQGAALETGMRTTLTQPLVLLPFLLFALLFGPIPEELGWRGYGLDALQRRWGALPASLALGLIWTLWHLPLFWIPDTYQNALGVGTPAFWLFMLDKVPVTVVMTWIYNNTGRSTLSAILFHFMQNVTGEVVALSLRAEAIHILLWYVLATAVAMGMWPLRKRRDLPLHTAGS